MAHDNLYLHLAIVSLGVASHLFFFKIGERHLYPWRYVQVFVLSCVLCAVAEAHNTQASMKSALQWTAKYALAYLVGVYTSLIVYRLFFNPLNKFPGPYWARLSKFDLVFRVAQRFNCYKVLHEMHKKHGQFVRIGPNDISVTHPDGTEIISGLKSKCTKSQWYSQDVPLTSMHTSRDRAQHDRRRRIWSPAFSDKALRGYEHRVQKYTDMLIQRLEESNGQPVNVSNWFNIYSFDVMGDLGFGKSFNMLTSGQLHWAMKLLVEGMDPMGFSFPPWIFRALIAIPGLASGYWEFIKYCSQQLEERIEMQGKMENPDITHTLIEHYEKGDDETKRAQLPMLQGDSRLIIVAGSDTTAITLVHVFYHIAVEKDLLKRLRQELDGLVKNGEKIQHQMLQDAPLLNGTINESLRLNPPVPSGVFRKTPPEGVQIGDTYIPGNTVIQMPHYAMGHDPLIWPEPESFIPERFSSRPNLMPYKDAFVPFSTGPYGCIGKNLAYMEVRLLTSQLIRKFDVSLAPGETGEKLFENSKDHFTMSLGDLMLCFEPRKA